MDFIAFYFTNKLHFVAQSARKVTRSGSGRFKPVDLFPFLAGGNHMGFDMMTIQSLRRRFVSLGCSPTDELLQLWGHQNHTILELFVLLSKMEHYQAMLVIKNFVDSEYHRLIYEGEANLSRLFKRPSASAPGPSQSVASVNFNQSETSNILPSKMKGVHVSSESESKILNVEEFQASRVSSTQNHNSNVPTALAKNGIPDQKATSKTTKGGFFKVSRIFFIYYVFQRVQKFQLAWNQLVLP